MMTNKEVIIMIIYTTQEYKEAVGYKPLVSDQGTRGYGIVDGKQKYHRLLIRRK